ncbi:MAG: uroporphyrinogen-III synthase [Deltaproteobacteria bacterium]|nr:uroporphyrinogen-III synthase [Deltaproteobacteria bacterium]
MAFAVLTRDPADAATYASALAPLEVVAMPVTRTVELSGALADADPAVDVVMVMSPRAAHMVVKGSVKAPAVWAVGPATKRALEIAKVAAHVPADVVDGVGLARALVQSGVAGKRVLVPRAEEGRTEPLDILRAAGAEVIDVIAYRTVPVAAEDPAVQRGRERLLGGEAAVCCVFAPSQVAALAQIVRLPEVRTRMCAIGETTAAAVRAAGVLEVAVAATPTPEGIAQAVRSVYPIGR